MSVIFLLRVELFSTSEAVDCVVDSPHVFFQMMLVNKAQAAHVAVKLALPVSRHVEVQTTLSLEMSTTNLAHPGGGMGLRLQV